MKLSMYSGNNYHIYSSNVNISQQADYPTIINLLLNNNISSEIKLNIIKQMKEEYIQESFLFAKNHKNIQNIFQAILANEGAWSINFSQKDSYLGEIHLKEEKKYRDELFLYFFNKFPVDLIQQSFLESSNILTALIVYELPLSLDKALQNISIDDKRNFFEQTKINFNYYNSALSLYYNIFNQDLREIIDILINHNFDLNIIDSNNQNICFYLKNKDLTEYLISKGLVFDLNFNDGEQTLKSFIKQQHPSEYDNNYLLFIENKISLLPFDLEENIIELLKSYKNDNKTLFKKKIDLFYTNTGNCIYDDISIKDLIIFYFQKEYCSNKNDKSSVLIKFLENKDIPYPKDLEPILHYSIYTNNKEKKDEIKISNNNILAFLDRIEYIISTHGNHFITNYLLKNISYIFFNMFPKNILDYSSLNNIRYNTLANLLFLNPYLGSDYNYNYNFKILIDILEKKNIKPPLTNLLKTIINKKDEKQIIIDIKVDLLDMDFYLIKLIQDNLTVINNFEDSKYVINSYLEKYMIKYNLIANCINNKEKSIKRL